MTKSRTVTADEMKQIEKRADEAGLSYYQMMENAGNAAYEIIKSERLNIDRIAVFCGKGNNGGDGFVVARLAAMEGVDVVVILVEGEPLTKDASTNYKLLPENVRIIDINEANDFLCNTDESTDVIVDALYGTGFHGELKESGIKACELMNKLDGLKVAIDLPSGCTADNGDVADGAFKADVTVCFDSWKNVHALDVYNCGKSVLADIGIPDACH